MKFASSDAFFVPAYQKIYTAEGNAGGGHGGRCRKWTRKSPWHCRGDFTLQHKAWPVSFEWTQDRMVRNWKADFERFYLFIIGRYRRVCHVSFLWKRTCVSAGNAVLLQLCVAGKGYNQWERISCNAAEDYTESVQTAGAIWFVNDKRFNSGTWP